MTILTVGIDLAKNQFAVHGVNEAGNVSAGANPLLFAGEAAFLIDTGVAVASIQQWA